MEFITYHKIDDASHIASLFFRACIKRKSIQLKRIFFGQIIFFIVKYSVIGGIYLNIFIILEKILLGIGSSFLQSKIQSSFPILFSFIVLYSSNISPLTIK